MTTWALILGLSFPIFASASEVDPALMALVGKHKLIKGDSGCPEVVEVEKIRAEESISIKDPSRSAKSELSIFPDINEGKITYYEDFVRIKQRDTVYEDGQLKKNLRTCSGIIMQTCYAWRTTSSLDILSARSFEISYNQKNCEYQK